ncbi:hypothetical protein KQI84_17375 [bacterium]|nr:hypothetical protein [bacterium]
MKYILWVGILAGLISTTSTVEARRPLFPEPAMSYGEGRYIGFDLEEVNDVLAVGEWGRVTFFDVQTGDQLPNQLEVPGMPFADISISPDKKHLCCLDYQGGGVWDIETNQLVWDLETGEYYRSDASDFSSDGERIVLQLAQLPGIYDLATHQLLITLENPDRDPIDPTHFSRFAFSPNESYVLGIGNHWDSTHAVMLTQYVIWDSQSGQILQSSSFSSFGAGNNQLIVFDGDESRFLYWSSSHARLTNFASSVVEWEYTIADDEALMGATLSRDGSLVALGFENGEVRVIDWASASTIRSFSIPQASEQGPRFLRFTSNQKRLIAGGLDLATYIWNLENGELVRRIVPSDLEAIETYSSGSERTELFWGSDYPIAVSPDGSMIAIGGVIHDQTSGEVIQRIEGHTDWISSVQFSADSSRVMTGSWDSTCRIWDIATGLKTKRFELPGWVHRAIFSPNESMIGVGYGFRDIAVLDANQKTASPDRGNLSFWSTPGIFTDVAFTPDGTSITGGGEFYPADIGAQYIQSGGAVSTEFSPDGQLCLLGDQVLSWPAGTELYRISNLFEAELSAATFSPDSSSLACAFNRIGEPIHIIDAQTGEDEDRVDLGDQMVHRDALVLMPDGESLLVGIGGAKALLFAPEKGLPLEDWTPNWLDQFDVPVFSETGRAPLEMTAIESSQLFGTWESPIVQLPSHTVSADNSLDGQTIIRATAHISTTETNPALVPQVRVRVNMADFRQADVLVIESSAGGEFSPTPEGRDYTLTFMPPVGAPECRFSFDMLNFDPADSQTAMTRLESFTIESTEQAFLDGARTEAVYDFEIDQGSWEFFALDPLAMSEHAYDAAGGRLGLAAADTEGLQFGAWSTNADDVAVESGRLYFARFTIGTNVSELYRMPYMRLRLNESSYCGAQYTEIVPGGAMTHLPSPGAPRTFSCFFPTGVGEGQALRPSFDILADTSWPNVSTEDWIYLERLELLSIATP